MKHAALAAAFTMGLAPIASAATWEWTWTPAPGDDDPAAEVTPFLYGKTWGYAIEIDDGPKSARAVAQPLFAQYHFTDAPPGVAGGRPMPFVGGVGVIVANLDTHNSHIVQPDDLRELELQGWGVINHSYAHQGRTWGDPPEILTPEQIRRDLFWSQALLADLFGTAPTHFIYPNGYEGYRPHLAEFGLRSASRVGAPNRNWDTTNPAADLTNLNRTYLDEGPWSSRGNGEADHNLPTERPAPGWLFMDFTHGISDDADSANRQRWAQRLELIESRWGAAGDDTLWCAPTHTLLDYAAARDSATVTVERGRVRVTLPDDIPGSRLTLKLTGIGEGTTVEAPDGGLIYREGDSVWVTTPLLGRPGARLPEPAVKRLYRGPVQDLQWDQPVALAAVRLLQGGPADEDFELRLDAATPDGDTVSLLPEGGGRLERRWQTWLLYDRVPNGQPLEATALRVTPNRALQQMEVWVAAPADAEDDPQQAPAAAP